MCWPLALAWAPLPLVASQMESHGPPALSFSVHLYSSTLPPLRRVLSSQQSLRSFSPTARVCRARARYLRSDVRRGVARAKSLRLREERMPRPSPRSPLFPKWAALFIVVSSPPPRLRSGCGLTQQLLCGPRKTPSWPPADAGAIDRFPSRSRAAP